MNDFPRGTRGERGDEERGNSLRGAEDCWRGGASGRGDENAGRVEIVVRGYLRDAYREVLRAVVAIRFGCCQRLRAFVFNVERISYRPFENYCPNWWHL